MNPIRCSISAVLAIALACMAMESPAAGPARPATSKSPVQAPSQREVGYQDLEKHVGERIVVHTTNGTVRSGTLLKYTNVSITVQLGPEAGAIELSMPRNTVRTAWVTIAPADPLFPSDVPGKQDADSGAKKN